MRSQVSDTAVALPAPALRSYITRYAGFHISAAASGLHVGLPSSGVHLIISLSHPIQIIQAPLANAASTEFTALLTGIQDSPAFVRQNTTSFGLHVFIQPLGVRALLGVPSSALSSQIIDLADLWRHRAAALRAGLAAAPTWRRRFALLDQTFMAHLRPAFPQPEISWSWQRLAHSRGSLSIAQLAKEIGYSRRHFGERFRDEVGVSPKLAARLFRFERACRLIAAGSMELAHIALACGFYDQAHLTREWYAFAGCSPRAWAARDLPFLQDYELAPRENHRNGFAPAPPRISDSSQ